MRILTVTNLYPPFFLGGYEILCRQMMTRLQERGHAIHILTSVHGSGPRIDTDNGIPIHRLLILEHDFDKPGSTARLPRMKTGDHNAKIVNDFLRRIDPDVVFIWSQLRLSIACSRTVESNHYPVVYTFNDDHLKSYVPRKFSGGVKSFIRAVTDRTVFKSTTLSGLKFERSACISECLKHNLVSMGVPVQHARVIYQGIPVEEFPVKSNPGQIHSPVRILYAGQLHQYKGVHTLLQAAGRIESGGPKIEITIAGDGPIQYRTHLNELARSLRNTSVLFIGRIPHEELIGIYRDQDLFVFPSIWQEPFGLTHLEAMASGTPVISTTDGGHGEFLRDGINSLTFEKENPDELAAKICRAVEDSQLRERIAETARRQVELEFSLDRYVTDWEQFLAETAKGRVR